MDKILIRHILDENAFDFSSTIKKSLDESVKEVLETTYPPNSEDERRFIAKHGLHITDYPKHNPNPSDAARKDKTKRASYEDDEDELVYEALKDIGDTVKVHTHKFGKSTGLYGKLSICKDTPAELHVDDPKTGGVIRFNKKTCRGCGEHSHLMLQEEIRIKTNRADKKAVIVHDIDPKTGQSATRTRKAATGEIKISEGAVNKISNISRINSIFTKDNKRSNQIIPARNFTNADDEDLTENFKPGSLKLQDGSSVVISSADAMALNTLFHTLSDVNQSKMDITLMKNKTGFAQILGFAKEAI